MKVGWNRVFSSHKSVTKIAVSFTRATKNHFEAFQEPNLCIQLNLELLLIFEIFLMQKFHKSSIEISGCNLPETKIKQIN